MASLSARWHLIRRQAILSQYPQIARLPKQNPLALISITVIPLMYAVLAYYCQFLTIAKIAFVGWFIGSFCNFCIFKYSHELSHHLVSPKIIPQISNGLLRYLNVFNISTSVYLLFSFGHKPHHACLGESSLSQAKRFLSEKHPDIELLIDRYYFELPYAPNSLPRSIAPKLFTHRLLRFLSVGLLFPLSSTIKGTLLFHLVLMVKFIQSFRVKHSELYHQRLNSAVIQIGLLYASLIALYCLGGIKPLIFMLISDVSQRGLLWHPISTFTISSHKTWQRNGEIQPTTSTYSAWLSFALMKMNYHVEHHDFPDIPCKYLPRLKKIAPEFYTEINYFKGYCHIFYQYLKSKHWYYAGGVVKSS